MAVSLTLRQLEVFAAIMRTGTVTGAARELGLTQPAVSKIIQHSESQIGVPLFQRRKGRLYPTENARAIFPAVDMVFQNANTVRLLINDLRDIQYGIIRIATVPAISAAFLPPAIATFLAGRTHIKVGIKLMGLRSLAPRVANRQVDLAITYGPAPDGIANSIELCSAEVVCVLPRTHTLAEKKTITPRDLEGQPLISVGRASLIGEAIDDAFKAAGVRRNDIVETSYAHVAYDLVARGIGIAVIDPFNVGHHCPEGVVVRPFRPAVRISPRVLYLADPPPSRICQDFIKHLKRAAKQALTSH